MASTAFAGSATWNVNPTNGGDWSTATNWTPNTVPNDPADVATFSVSNRPTPALSEPIALAEMIFAPGASAYTIGFARGRNINLYGTGITNNSGSAQHFLLDQFRGVSAQIVFHNSATAGDETVFSVTSPYPIPGLFFIDTSSAGTSTIINNSTLDDVHGGDVTFTDGSTAADSTIINDGGLFSGGQGGNTTFLGSGNGSATAGNATITAEGGRVSGALGGTISFGTGAHAGNATLIANSGVAGADGGVIVFFGVATGDRARVELFDTGSLLLSPLTTGVTIGSLEGNGVVFLDSKSLTIGSSDLSTTFSGVIQDSGSITKIGKGRLALSGANTYTGGTTINQGTLRVGNTTGSATGTGSVQVDGGRLGGTGIVGGETTIGPGSTAVAILEPSAGGKKPATLTIQSALHFKGSVFNYQLNTKRAVGDQVVANGVSIENQDQFTLATVSNVSLPIGQVFVAISNTAATPISGTFGNLPDGATITAGRNTFQANYEGGDGNDFTLTVVP